MHAGAIAIDQKNNTMGELTPWLAALAGLSLLPFILGPYWLNSAIVGLFYVMMASSWNLLAGFTGQVSFAHAAFAGIGCYTSGILSAKLGLHPLLGLPVGVAMAAILSLALGALCIRMGGIYLSLTTLGFSEIVRIIIQNEYEITDVHRAPLWEANDMGPRFGVASPKLAFRSENVLIKPKQLGPIIRILFFFAMSKISFSICLPSEPISEKPAVIITTDLTPALPQSEIASLTNFGGIQITAISTGFGTSAID